MLHAESSLPSPRTAFALWLKENAHALTLGGGGVGTIVGGLLYFNGAIVSLKASNEANAKLLDSSLKASTEANATLLDSSLEANAKLLDSSLKASTEANAKLLDERIAHLDKTIANIAELARLNAEIESHKTLRDFKVSFAVCGEPARAPRRRHRAPCSVCSQFVCSRTASLFFRPVVQASVMGGIASREPLPQ